MKEKADIEGATNLNQFINEANYDAHYRYTSLELVNQINAIGKIPTAIVAGIGTSGHIAAISKRMKETFGKDVKIVGVQPTKGDSIPGIKRIETKPKWLSLSEIDFIEEVSRNDAINEVIKIARNEGLLIGLSAGAVVKAFKNIKVKLGSGLYVLIFPDDAFKYIEIIASYL